jgi:glycosyltransferase involved in cell wall biosynthesis
MNILLLNWKDIGHSQAGGAEIVTHEILKRAVKNGHKVTLLTAQYEGSNIHDEIDGVKIIRAGKGRLSHYFSAYKYYKNHLKNQFDVIIEEVNTLPYLLGIYKGSEKHFLFYHQLAREIWFYEMIQPLSLIGYLLEPIYTFLQSRISPNVITISESTKKDMMRFGFQEKNISIISEAIENKPLKSLKKSQPKESQFTLLFHSSLRKMKRPLEVFKAFQHLLVDQPEAQLWISGGGDQIELREYAELNGFLNSVTFFGRTSDEQKFDLMQRSHVLCSTSIKEGWGLIVSEANSMGTPAISYDVDGLRDSTKFGGGIVCEANSEAMGKELKKLALTIENQDDVYQDMRNESLKSTNVLNFDTCYKEFMSIIETKS